MTTALSLKPYLIWANLSFMPKVEKWRFLWFCPYETAVYR